MVSYSRMIRHTLGAAGFAVALSMAQASATESIVVSSDPVAANAVVVVPAATVADAADRAAAVAVPDETAPLLSPATGTEASSAATMAAAPYPVVKRRRAAATRPYRHVASNGYGSRCSDAWCGPHFVLMVGVGY